MDDDEDLHTIQYSTVQYSTVQSVSISCKFDFASQPAFSNVLSQRGVLLAAGGEPTVVWVFAACETDGSAHEFGLSCFSFLSLLLCFGARAAGCGVGLGGYDAVDDVRKHPVDVVARFGRGVEEREACFDVIILDGGGRGEEGWWFDGERDCARCSRCRWRI